MAIQVYFKATCPRDTELLIKLQEVTGQKKPSSASIKHYLWLALCQGQIVHASISTGNASKPVVEPNSTINVCDEVDELDYGIE